MCGEKVRVAPVGVCTFRASGCACLLPRGTLRGTLLRASMALVCGRMRLLGFVEDPGPAIGCVRVHVRTRSKAADLPAGSDDDDLDSDRERDAGDDGDEDVIVAAAGSVLFVPCVRKSVGGEGGGRDSPRPLHHRPSPLCLGNRRKRSWALCCAAMCVVRCVLCGGGAWQPRGLNVVS
jgi:hypothetical protein